MAKVKVSFYVDPEVAEEIRNTVSFLAGPPVRMTLGKFLEEAVKPAIARLTWEHNGSIPFPVRGADLRPGPALKSASTEPTFRPSPPKSSRKAQKK